MEHVECLLQRYDVYRGARITRADHVNLYVPDAAQPTSTTAGSASLLGVHCGGFRRAARGRMALPQADGPRRRARPAAGRLHHVAFTTAETSAITVFCDMLAGARRERDRARTPDGTASRMRSSSTCATPTAIASSSSRATTTPAILTTSRSAGAHPTRRRTFWGHHVPDSWYEEGSLVRGRTGRPAELAEPPWTSAWWRSSERRSPADGSRRYLRPDHDLSEDR